MKKLFILTLLICLLTGCVATSTSNDTTITFSDNGISTSLKDGIVISGSSLTINKEGTYTVTGSPHMEKSRSSRIFSFPVRYS